MPSSALLFPGQGSHAEGMDEPYRGHPLFERGLELLGHDPFDRLAEGTRYQQPALFLCSIAAWDQWREEAEDEDEASAAAGHSLGEYAALVAAGALQFDDAVRLVDERAAAMADAGEINAGGMIAMLGGDAQGVRALASRLGLVVANDNAPGQLVLSGPVDALVEAEDVARDEVGARARRLDVTGAFHSPLMEPAAERLRAALAGHADRRAARSRSTPTAAPRPSSTCAASWPRTCCARCAGARRCWPCATSRIERFVELGPGSVLTGLVKRTLQAAA